MPWDIVERSMMHSYQCYVLWAKGSMQSLVFWTLISLSESPWQKDNSIPIWILSSDFVPVQGGLRGIEAAFAGSAHSVGARRQRCGQGMQVCLVPSRRFWPIQFAVQAAQQRIAQKKHVSCKALNTPSFAFPILGSRKLGPNRGAGWRTSHPCCVVGPCFWFENAQSSKKLMWMSEAKETTRHIDSA